VKPVFVSEDVTVNGIKIHTYRTNTDKPPVVLAHGITDNGLCWNRLAGALAQNYEVVTFDARGHGLSEANPPDFTIESHAADLAGLVNALGLEKPVMIGHSMGASNVALAATTYSDMATAVILEDPPWGLEFSAEDRAARIEEWREEDLERKSQTVEEIIDAGRKKHPEWAMEEWPDWAEANQQVNPDVLEWMRSATPFAGWRELVPKIKCPVLLITGDPELEALVTPDTAQTVLELSDRVEVAAIDRVGHNIRRENFEEYVSVVSRFLRRVF